MGFFAEMRDETRNDARVTKHEHHDRIIPVTKNVDPKDYGYECPLNGVCIFTGQKLAYSQNCDGCFHAAKHPQGDCENHELVKIAHEKKHGITIC